MIRLCVLDEIPLGMARPFVVGGTKIAIYRTREEQVFAVADRCPHKGGPLSDGMLAGDQIVCPLHAFRFDRNSGSCDQPHVCPVTAYPVSVQNGIVSVDM
ncbi:MAG: nitrite reductase small subunit NirD [Bacteroidales bacterium]|nr:nitrite reductase small subunit NirD [Bacteroidales bacterium]